MRKKKRLEIIEKTLKQLQCQHKEEMKYYRVIHKYKTPDGLGGIDYWYYKECAKCGKFMGQFSDKLERLKDQKKYFTEQVKKEEAITNRFTEVDLSGEEIKKKQSVIK